MTHEALTSMFKAIGVLILIVFFLIPLFGGSMKSFMAFALSFSILCGTTHAQMANDALTELTNERDRGEALKTEIAILAGPLQPSLSASLVDLYALDVTIRALPDGHPKKATAALNYDRIMEMHVEAQDLLCRMNYFFALESANFDGADLVTSGLTVGECLDITRVANSAFAFMLPTLRGWQPRILQEIPGRVAATTAYLEG